MDETELTQWYWTFIQIVVLSTVSHQQNFDTLQTLTPHFKKHMKQT